MTAKRRASIGDRGIGSISRKSVESVGLGAGDKVSIALQKGRIVVAPAARPKYELAELLKRCKPGARLSKAERVWLDAPAAGKEAL